MILPEKRIIQMMKQYLKTLWLALMGCNPYESELASLREKYEKTAERVTGLQELYFKTLELNDQISRQVDRLEKRGKGDVELIENLRKRIREKDELIDRMKKDYQKHIELYTEEIDKLRNKD